MLPELDHASVQVYAALLTAPHSTVARLRKESGLPDEVITASLDALLALRLATTDDGRFSAVDPRVAAGELLDPAEERLRAEQQAADTGLQQLRAMRRAFTELRPLYSEGSSRRSCDHGVETLVGEDVISAAVLRAAYEAESEVLTMQARTEPGAALLSEGTVQRDLAVVDRGVRLRSLYEHSVRVALELRSHVDRLTRLGGEVRTVQALCANAVVFDEKVAFLLDVDGASASASADDDTRTACGEDGPSAARAIVVREPTLVRYLRGQFEAVWCSGSPVRVEQRGYGEAIGAVHRAVAQLLAEGLKDETAARRLGVSVRSFRRHVAALSESLQAESRFQAGVAAARAGLLHDVSR